MILGSKNKSECRPGIRANRAGTRGFRAPEVLFKVPEQTNGSFAYFLFQP